LQSDGVVRPDGTLQCSIEIKNISDVAGEEVVQGLLDKY